jgi:hypothetical protein
MDGKIAAGESHFGFLSVIRLEVAVEAALVLERTY